MIKRSNPNSGGMDSFGRFGSGERNFQAHKRFNGLSPWMLCLAFLPFVIGLAAVLGMAGCSGYVSKPGTSVSVTPTISVAIIQAPLSSLIVGSTAQVSATVANDTANAGVDWVAACASAPLCGSFSPAHTASGGTTTYTAPIAVPAHSPIAVSALSATDHSKASTVSVTIISSVTGVVITQPPPAVPSGATLTLAATVLGDPSNLGVDWTATCGALNCTPPGLHSASGGNTLFFVPGPLQIPFIMGKTITLTAFATADHNISASASFTVAVPITISLTQVPPSTMLPSANAPVLAKVANDPTNSGVTWSVTCASAPCGSISPVQTASGETATFTAPPTVPTGNPPNPVVTITATGAFGVSATATVTIVAPISVKITQGVPNGSIVQNATAPLVAKVSSDPASGGIDWTVTCGGPGPCGSFSPTHTASGVPTTFTAPSAVQAGNMLTITATSTSDSTKNDTEVVTVTATASPSSLLLGQFVIQVTAKNSGNGPYALGGVITGDGIGNITSGAFDLADASGHASGSIRVISPSTYSIGSDGRGQITLQFNTNSLGFSFGVSGSITMSVVFATPKHALLSETDSFGSGTGTLDFQNATDLASFVNGTGLNGVYSFKLSGVEAATPNPGYFVAGAVSIHSSTSSYTETAYITDQSDNGVMTSVQSPVPYSHSGQAGGGALNIGELPFFSVDLGLPTLFNLDIWLIDANHFAITDWRDSANGTPPVIFTGYLTLQPSSPSVSGTYAFTESGATTRTTTPGKPQVAGGILTCGSTGTLDVTSLNGTPVNNQPISAACTAPANGRGVITISGAGSTAVSQFAAYPTLDQGLYLIELDGGAAGTSGPSGAGVALQQTLSIPISKSALSGKYASNFLASTPLGSQNFAAQIISDGAAAISGSADVNSLDAIAIPSAGTPSFAAALTGAFTAGTNGRFPLMLSITPAAGQPTPEFTNINPVCYIVDANTCLLLGLDATAPGTGILQFQNTGL
jgi:hypothetical protein